MYLENPEFWNKSSPGYLLKFLLTPLKSAYLWVARKNYARPFEYESKSSTVVAIGAVTMGGSGKTIVASALCDILKSLNKKVAVLSRGYGRSRSEILQVNPNEHTFKDVGDEPLLLSERYPVIVGENRGQGMLFAEKKLGKLDFFLLDDGIMQRSLKPDIRLLVVDNQQKFGNGEVFPLGPNRLPFEDIQQDIDAIIYLRNEKDPITELPVKFSPIITGVLKQDYSKINENDKFYAFCGLGYPEKFFNSLRRLNVVKTRSFPDHYPYTNMILYKLENEAQNLGAKLITTEKDLMRIPMSLRKFVDAISVKIVWDDEEQIKNLILRKK